MYSTRLIQRSWPLKSLGGAIVLYFLLYFCTPKSRQCFQGCYFLLFYSSHKFIYKSDSSPSTLLAISLMTPSTSNSHPKTSRITPCSVSSCLVPAQSNPCIQSTS